MEALTPWLHFSAGASLTWNELTIAQAYVLICMSGKSKRPSDLVGPYANFEQPALSYAASLIDLVAERRLQFKRANGRTCINVCRCANGSHDDHVCPSLDLHALPPAHSNLSARLSALEQ